jgi:hypothetical protein
VFGPNADFGEIFTMSQDTVTPCILTLALAAFAIVMGCRIYQFLFHFTDFAVTFWR